LFKSISYDGPGQWTITDDDFSQKTVVSYVYDNIHCTRVNAVISVYKNRKLNVAANIVRLLMHVANSDVNSNMLSIEQQIYDNIQYNYQYVKYKDEVDKYLLLK
jgi:hypothetical protein